MKGANFLALLLIVLAVFLFAQAVTGNYKAVWAALNRRYQGGSRLFPAQLGSNPT